MSNYVVFTNTDTQESAKQMAKILVTEHLAACCTINLNVTSIFSWDGAIEESIEQQLMIKTTDVKVEALIQRIKELNPNEVPEIIAVPIVKGNDDYFLWMEAITNE
jgi:periplasmic divalent cation tolerance protein